VHNHTLSITHAHILPPITVRAVRGIHQAAAGAATVLVPAAAAAVCTGPAMLLCTGPKLSSVRKFLNYPCKREENAPLFLMPAYTIKYGH